MTHKVLTEKEIATELGLSAWTVRRMRLQEKMPHIKVGHRILYRLSTVLEWLAEREHASVNQETEEYGVLRRIH